MMHCYVYNVGAATTVKCAEDTFNVSLAGGLICSCQLVKIIFSMAFDPFMVLRPFEKLESGTWWWQDTYRCSVVRGEYVLKVKERVQEGLGDLQLTVNGLDQ